MSNLRKNQNGFTLVEGLLLIIAVTLIGGVGYYVLNANKDDKAVSASDVSSTSRQSAKKETTVNTPTESDETLIIAAVRSDIEKNATKQEAAQEKITVNTIAGDNGIGNRNNGETGAEFIAHKDGGTWSVIYTGQQKPGKDIGVKYDQPTDWYSADY